MKFFKSLWKSLYDVSYYHHEGQQYTFWKAVWRYMRLTFLVGVILGGIGAALFAHLFTKENVIKFADTTKNIAIQTYPNGLVLDISAESGVVTNTTGPVIFSMQSIRETLSGNMIMGNTGMRNGERKHMAVNGSSYDTDNRMSYENILVIDPKSTGDIGSYHTIALLTNSQLIIQAKENEKRVYEVSSAMKGNPPIHLTSQIVKVAVEGAATRVTENSSMIVGIGRSMIAVCLLVALVFGSFFVGLIVAIVLYLYSLIVWLVSKAMSTQYSYRQIYSMSTLGFTLPFFFIWSSFAIKAIVLCLIVGRVIYIQKRGEPKNA